MRHSLIRLNLAAAIMLGMLVGGSNADAQSVMKMCGDQWKAAKAAGTTNGETWQQFLAQCRAQPKGASAAATSTTSPAPLDSRPLPPTPASAPAPTPDTAAPEPTGAKSEFTSDQQAGAHCPSATVVWVNTRSRIYHFAGTHNYGHTKEGAYMCEADARAAGDRAALNELHP